jgi:SAM-dependent methyltransferase
VTPNIESSNMNRSSARTRTEIAYHGKELEQFAEAINWKKYWSSKLRGLITGYVIEVGAGLGSSTKFLHPDRHARWLCLDPDPRFASNLAQRITTGDLPQCCEAKCGVLGDLPPEELADTILYIDVLEHIKNDEAEMRIAAAHLRSGGRIIVLSPAFNWLYSPYDRAIGHYRRYTRRDAKRLTVPQLSLQQAFYLDSVGLFASLANRLLLRAAAPSSRQIAVWDRMMVPASIYADRLFGSLFGRTIIMIWKKVTT